MSDHPLAVLDTPRCGEDGQTSVEYAAVLLLGALVLAVALTLGLTGVLDSTVDAIMNKL